MLLLVALAGAKGTHCRVVSAAPHQPYVRISLKRPHPCRVSRRVQGLLVYHSIHTSVLYCSFV